eukprot:3389319-Pleurochrysis_carterae.AAC.1
MSVPAATSIHPTVATTADAGAEADSSTASHTVAAAVRFVFAYSAAGSDRVNVTDLTSTVHADTAGRIGSAGCSIRAEDVQLRGEVGAAAAKTAQLSKQRRLAFKQRVAPRLERARLLAARAVSAVRLGLLLRLTCVFGRDGLQMLLDAQD